MKTREFDLDMNVGICAASLGATCFIYFVIGFSATEMEYSALALLDMVGALVFGVLIFTGMTPRGV